MKYIILAGVIFIVYRFLNPPIPIEEPKDDPNDFVDYEEID